MRVQIQVRIVSDDDTVLSDDVIACFDKGDDQLEEIGLSLEQAKTVLAGAQTSLVAAQVASFLRTWSRRSAPRRDHRICWGLAMRQLTRKLAVASVSAVPTRKPARWRSA